MVEQHRENGATPLTLLCLRPRGVEERPCLSVAQGRRLALVALDLRALHPLHWVVGHGVRITESRRLAYLTIHRSISYPSSRRKGRLQGVSLGQQHHI
jgi:hypothetical protein